MTTRRTLDRWRRIGLGAAAWLAVPATLTAVDVLQNPGQYRVTFEPRAWLLRPRLRRS